MNKKQQQNVAMLYLASFSSIIVSLMIESKASNLMDFSQGILAGIGFVGMLVTIVTLGRHRKRSYQ
ncbi:hypothetical protein [Paenibacillus typhae]|uniref:hypothetical protein n=1 Tax=Paenibacillus typhae TaxID=1174501 RepID=UPI001C8D821E|nr:hypothetical protein [Paenibacillus typhae]MBY0012412.1 hypothetical protein [Paenibacillus typhae]